MTIKSSGLALSLVEIAAEYSGSGSHSLSEYYTAPGLPASGAISFADFYNKSDTFSAGTKNTTISTAFTTTRLTRYPDAEGPHGPAFNYQSTPYTAYRNTTVSTADTTTWSADNPT